MSEQPNPRPPRDIIRATPPAVQFRAVDDDTDPRPVVFGHPIRTNEWTRIDSFFEGTFMERVAPRAAAKTLKERRDQIRVLFQHGRDPQVGDKPIAEIEELREDDEGVYYEARLLDGLPDLLMAGLRAGQYGQSFRMEVLREEYIERPERSDHNPDGIPERTIKEIRLHEFGPVTFPAYQNTTAHVRSLTDEFVFEWLKREPQRARELIGAHDLTHAAMRAASTTQDPAPSTAGAAPTGTPAPVERRDANGRHGLIPPDPRPTWAL